jgi:protein tyrosine kinase modulator
MSQEAYDGLDDSYDEKPAKNLRDYWEMAVRRRWVILLPLFLCWILVWTASWFIPSVYTSDALILVEQQKIPESYVVPNVTMSLQDRLQGMTEQVLSRTRLQAAIDGHHLYQDRRLWNRLLSGETPVQRMRRDIKIEPVKSASHAQELTAFRIYYSASSPQLAQQINNELVSLFVQEDLKTQQQFSQETTAFLQSELADAKVKLEEQEAKVRAFKTQHFEDLPSQAQTNVQILSGLQNQLQNTQRDLDRAKQQKIYLQSLQQQYQSAQANLAAPDSSGLSAGALDKELSQLRLQLADARTRLTEEHPDIIALQDKIAKREKLKKETVAEMEAQTEKEKATQSGKPAASPELQGGAAIPMMQVQSQLKAIELEIQNSEQRVKELEAQIASYRGRLNMTPQTEQQLADISRGYEESKANYNSLLQKQNQSQLATSLQERQQGQQFRILDSASWPYKPSAPNRLILSVGGLLAGAGIGLGLAFLIEMKNVMVRKDEDVETLIPARILVGIPHLTVPGEVESMAFRRWLEICAVSLITVMILAGNFLSYHKG